MTSDRRRPRRLIRAIACLLSSIVLIPAVTTAGATATDTDSGAPADAVPRIEKIRPQLMTQLSSGDTTDFWVRFDDSADLSAARKITDWVERGTAVAEALKETAASSQSAVRQELDRAGVTYQAFWATNALKVENGSLELAEQMAGHAEVESVHPSFQVAPPEPIADPTAVAEPGAVEWGIASINADDVWADYDTRGEGIVIANIDTGVQFDHPALVDHYRGNNGDGTFDHDYNWFDANGAGIDHPVDEDGHGTHTMGTMVGDDGADNHIGVAPGATWIAANGCCASDATLVASGQWMLEPTDLNGENPDAGRRPDVINNSWGSQIPSTAPFMEDISAAWEASGIFSAWSNGNSGPACGTSGSPGSRIINYSTGAYGIDNTIGTFSSRGAGQDGEIKPNISAPGVNVRSAAPGSTYQSLSGTSMAAPHVAGTVALLWSAAPAVRGNVAATKNLLDGTAIDQPADQCGGTAEDNNVFGEGRLDALALLDASPVGEAGSLTGTVTDSVTGEPIAGATVSIAGPMSLDLAGAEDGTFTAPLRVGEYSVTVARFGYADQTFTVEITANRAITRDIALVAMPTRAIHGVVTDGGGHGWPLYAKITIDGYPDGPVHTDPFTGDYRVDLPMGADYSLHVEPLLPGYRTTDLRIDVEDGDVNQDVSVPVDDSGDSCAAPGYAFSHDGLTETFTGWADQTAQDSWTNVDHLGNGAAWHFDNPGSVGSPPDSDGEFAVMDALHYFLQGTATAFDASLVSPVIDLSDQTAPVIGFDTLYQHGSGSAAAVDLSLDGGTTWSTVWNHTSTNLKEAVRIAIPQAAGSSQVRVRFHYTASWSRSWAIDNVFVGGRACAPADGGLVAGIVVDGNTGSGLVGAQVATTSDLSATTTATPDDDALPDGFYWMFSPRSGPASFTATQERYAPATAQVDIGADTVTRHDFSLGAGLLTVTPNSIETSVRLDGGAASQTVTFGNDGTEPVHVTLSERAAEFTAGTDQEAAEGAPVRLVEGHVTPASPLSTPLSSALGATAFGDPDGAAPTDTAPNAPPWITVADHPTPVIDNAVASLDGAIYSVGGYDGSAITARGHVYDPVEQKWTAIADAPKAVDAAGAAFAGNTMYLIGGWDVTGPSSDVHAYDPATDAWTAVAPLPTALAAFGVAVHDDDIYVIGGCTTNDCAAGSSTYRYDPDTDSWSERAPYPEPVAWHACAGVPGQIVCAGGNTGSISSSKATYAYDPDTDTWTVRAPMPYSNWGMASSAASGTLQVIGGVTGAGTVTNRAAAFDPATDTWSELPNANHAVYRAGGTCGTFKVGGDPGTGSPSAVVEMLPGHRCDTDVSWLTASDTEFDVAPGEAVDVRVTLDAAGLGWPGAYAADIVAWTNTPYVTDPIPVTVHAEPARTWGLLQGTVTDADTGEPIAGAFVQIEALSGSTEVRYTLKTDDAGRFQRWIDRRYNPLQVVVYASDYQAEVVKTRVNPRTPMTLDVELRAVNG